MATKVVYIPAQLHRELEILASHKGKTLTELVSQLLRDALNRVIDQDKELREMYKITYEPEYQEMVEDFLRATAEILPEDEWPEYQQ